MAVELTDYITKARKKNLTDEQIKKQLIEVGWSQEQVAEALAKEADLPVPPPPSVAHVGMWTGFLYILFFISLYVFATAVAGILTMWVDRAIPTVITNANDPSAYDLSYFWFFSFDTPSVIRGYLAAIIVSFPILLGLAIILKKQLAAQPLVKNLRSRKILIYITLIGTFLIMLGNIISTIYNLLSGTITGNGLGHLLVTIIVAGAIFGYFISEVKHDRNS